MTAPGTLQLGRLLHAVKLAARWDERDRMAPAVLDAIALKKAAADLSAWAQASPKHDGARAAVALAELAAVAATLPLHEHSRDARIAVEKAARVVQLVGAVPYVVGEHVTYVYASTAPSKTEPKPSALTR
jgi:hypothetical protein